MNVKKFLPEKEKTVLVQAHIGHALVEKVNKKRQELNVTWNELQEAMFRAFLEDTKRD